MRFPNFPALFRRALVSGGACSLLTMSLAAAEPGLIATYQSAGQTDAAIVPNVWLHVPAGQPATPFLAPGRVTVEWVGNLNADLRGDYKFKAALRGALKLEINGAVVLEGSGDGTREVGPGKEVRLNKGANPLKATFTAPESGDAWVRLNWSEYGFLWEPIASGLLTHDLAPPAVTAANHLRLGRELLLEGRCVKCHATGITGGVPELQMDAPAFAGIGSRLNSAWMAKWILDPKAGRASAQMPRLVHGASAAADAAAMAAFLGSLKHEGKAVAEKTDGASLKEGKRLVEALHCAGCHQLPGGKEDAGKLPLALVNEKFPAGELAAFLKEPTAHFQWRRMPNFQLKAIEAEPIAGYLRSLATNPDGNPSEKGGAGLVERGRQLVQTVGCLNCHQLDLPNQFRAKSLAELNFAAQSGCLAVKASEKLPHYGFAASEARAIRAFAATDRKSLERHAPVEFAERHARNLNCRACHGQLDGFPPYERLGGKLKPEWMAEFLGGKIAYKPRPWLPHRMPVFPALAGEFARGLAMSHGYPPVTPAEPPMDAELAKVGRKLVGIDGGFSCISCHGVGSMTATQVFEAEGLNLAYPAARLQKDYYLRWVLNPLRIQPQTKMPVYFDEQGNSPLFDVLEGNTLKQLDAFWQYMRAGDKIQPPVLE